ncbi:MAG: tetratricopeptide repeat protein [Rhodospirillales bacterium]|nr:tetratricopeptide repeat protein [Rhodospirillales bacterium]
MILATIRVGAASCVLALLSACAGTPDLEATHREGLALYQAGQYAEAAARFEQALDVGEKQLGRDHVTTASLLGNLAETYRSQGRYAEAEPLLRRAVTIIETSQGRNHPSLILVLNSQAAIYVAQGRYSDAEPLHKRALGIAETARGQDHPDVAQS